MSKRLPVVSVLAVTCLAFLNALGGGLVFDDRAQIANNPTLRSLAYLDDALRGAVWQFAAESSDVSAGLYYRPFFNTALIVNYQLFGDDLRGWHAVSLLLHLGATGLVFALARCWGLERASAAVAALLFGVHPIHVESVAWASGLPDPLAAVFVIGSLVAHERTLRVARFAPWRAASVALLALFAMLAKEVAMALPLFVALQAFGGAGGQRASLPLDRGDGWWTALRAVLARCSRPVAPFFVAALVALIMRWRVLGFIGGVEPRAADIPGAMVLWTLPSTVLAYVRMLVLPYPLAVVYDHDFVASPAAARFWAALLALGLMAAAAIRLASRSEVVRRSLLFAGVFLLPALNLKVFNPHESLLHDRYLYLPSVGASVLAAAGLSWLADRFGAYRRQVFGATAIAIAAVLFALTVAQNRTWRDDGSLAEHALRWAPRSGFLLDHLGRFRADAGELAEADRLLRAAIEVDPAVGEYYSDLAGVLATAERYAEAEAMYAVAIERGATHALTHLNLGITFLKQDKAVQAERALRDALARAPRNAQVLAMLGLAQEQQGRVSDAEVSYRRAVELAPSAVEPRMRLGELLARTERDDEAIVELSIVRRLAPHESEALSALGALYLERRRCREAADILGDATRVSHPARALTLLGIAYECLGDIESARTAYRRAIEAAPDSAAGAVARDHLSRVG